MIQGINSFASLWQNKKDDVYHQLEHLPLPSLPNGYESSLYQLRLPGQLSVILAIDEDPVFEQIILTLFRVFQVSDFQTAYQSIAESLYQEFVHENRQMVKMSE